MDATRTLLKARVKQFVGPEWHDRTRSLRRLRWLSKYNIMRGYKASVPVYRRLSYVLLDPEIESFSFRLADEQAVIGALATALGRPVDELVEYAAETCRDPELNGRLAAHLRWRVDVKHRPALGTRLAWYVMVRALKPELVVETGIYMGFGSLVILCALERNKQEGSPGVLMSFDTSPRAGSIVREELRGAWHRVVGLTGSTLVPALAGRRVGILFHDTVHTEENQRMEFEAALSHAAPHLVLVDGSGGYVGTLEGLCRGRGGAFHAVPVWSRGHIYPGGEFTFGVFANPELTSAGSGCVAVASGAKGSSA